MGQVILNIQQKSSSMAKSDMEALTAHPAGLVAKVALAQAIALPLHLGLAASA